MIGFEWQRRDILTADDARLATYTYAPAGLPDEAPTLVMAHGWTLDHRSWDRVAGELATRGTMRLVTWDQRGHGASTLARGGWRGRDESVRALGEDLFTVMGAAVPEGSPVVVAGHSMGGMTVMAFAGLHPEVLGQQVIGAVLVSTSAGELRGFKLPGEALVVRALGHVPLRIGRLATRSSQRLGGFGAHARREDVLAAQQQIAGTRIATTSTFYRALMLHDELAALAGLSRIPVRILVGSRDLLTPKRHARRLAESMPEAELTIVPGAGHMVTYEAPEQVCAAVDDVMKRSDD